LESATSPSTSAQHLTVSDAARHLGVHANTLRSWTDAGLIACLRINGRGDRRYERREIERFLGRSRRDANRAPRRATQPGRPDRNELLERSAALIAGAPDLQAAVAAAAQLLTAEAGYSAAIDLPARAKSRRLVGTVTTDRRLASRAAERREALTGRPRADGSYTAALPYGSVRDASGVLLLQGTPASRGDDEPQLMAGLMNQLRLVAVLTERLAGIAERQRRADLLMTMGSELGARMDPTAVLSKLVDHATDMFSANHAAVFSRRPEGYRAQVTRNLSAEFVHCIEHASNLPLANLAVEQHRFVTVADYPDDPRAVELRPALVKEGINTISIAPLLSEGEALGSLALYHDRRYEWSAEDIAIFERLASQGATTIRSAQNYTQMETWAAQLQSIQQLGARLTRLRSVTEIGQAICVELNQLINSHNIRVYRVAGDECMPVAWRGEVGEYEGEDGEQLRVKVGEGVTGWVARYGLAQNVGDAASDRRAKTIPGTEDDLDESLLLAPMLYEDQTIGVIVLAKLGLNQFTADDLRLLEIYASIAAQAMANADVTERLRAQSEMLAHQLDSQRELLRVTESLLGTLDTQALLEQIADSLGALLHFDNISVDVYEQHAQMLRPIFARGVHAAQYMATSQADDLGVSSHVIRTGEALLIEDELADSRVAHFPSLDPQPGALIVAPLRSGERIQGLLTIERLGAEARFSDDEFELVKLFAAHVSIALRNAATHRAVELRAETDRLTGLWNHGALIEQVDQLVASGARFSMLMVDLDFFKLYNDQFGHQAGNVMLQRVARLLRSSCRDDDRVFRYGGDEFALLLPGTGLTGARTVAEKINRAVAEAGHGPGDVQVTCSIGVAVYPKDGVDGASIIMAADRACYAGKRAGRDRVATAAEGLALAGEFRPTEPTPLELPEASYSVA